MPGMDGTGPTGQGVATGRGLGPCRNQQQPQATRQPQACCIGFRKKRRAGMRGGCGISFGRRFNNR
ncbi:DUF5320 domain-containing protein [Lentisphaerota bacterium ZTH]|nr:DUF5320 domain-containing protein [Lentisphaerota bacterium]WET05118.1 DUF5320 domain-containing protein [Lentisphaerota bacterium ZTH]